LAALSVGQKLKLMVDSVAENGAKFKSDDLPGAAILTNKHHMTDCPAVVQFVDQDFAVVSLNDAAQLTLIHTCSHLNEVILFESERLKVGMTLTVEVVEPSCEQLEGLPLVLWKGSVPRRQRTTSENQTDSSGHRFGDILEGKVRSVKPTCIQVALGDGTTGSVHVSQVLEPAEVRLGSFPTSTVRVGSVVKARVIGGREATSHRLTQLVGYNKPFVGDLICNVCKFEVQEQQLTPQVGLLVKLPFGGVGTVYVTDLADSYRPNPLEMFSKDQFVSVDTEDELVDLSLLPADTGKPDVLPESLGLPLRLVGNQKKRDPKKAKKRSPSESEQVAPSTAGPLRLQVAAGFSWDVGLSSLKPALEAKDGESSDREEEDGNNKPQKKSRHELEQEKSSAEKALSQREAELMDPNLRPQDAATFERLLLASPNSSLLWLQYMAHHLQATEIEQARAVAERALKTISFREEQEKLNVWVALLNLENMYGTEESLKKVFERAVQFCKPMPVYQQLADIYGNSNKIKEAEGLYKTMVKRFRQNKAVWLSYGSFLLQQGQSDAATSLLQRALNSLPPKDSVDVITKFAQLEFRFGDAEKGRNMFDKVLTSYPKRTDLWSVYIDLMVKHGSQKEVRAIFDRVIHLSVSVKKIKFFFKRYLEYEKKHGTPQSVQAVKAKAIEFVEENCKDATN
ncbi:hypothetical protein GOODEAATRI_005369, partial [Goodea atripinnis]